MTTEGDDLAQGSGEPEWGPPWSVAHVRPRRPSGPMAAAETHRVTTIPFRLISLCSWIFYVLPFVRSSPATTNFCACSRLSAPEWYTEDMGVSRWAVLYQRHDISAAARL